MKRVALLGVLALTIASCPRENPQINMLTEEEAKAKGWDLDTGGLDFDHRMRPDSTLIVHGLKSTISVLEATAAPKEDPFNYREIRVGLRNKNVHYKIDRETGELWWCSGQINYLTDTRGHCYGLDEFERAMAELYGSTPMTFGKFCEKVYNKFTVEEKKEVCRLLGLSPGCEPCPRNKQ